MKTTIALIVTALFIASCGTSSVEEQIDQTNDTTTVTVDTMCVDTTCIEEVVAPTGVTGEVK